MYPRSRCVCVLVTLLALACLAGVSAADDYNIAPITDTNLNGIAASDEMSGNPRYFDWDTPDEPHLAWVSEDIFAGGSTSIVVADDTVFVYCTGTGGSSSSDYTYMVAMNATNGEMLWATEIAPAEFGSWASPAPQRQYFHCIRNACLQDRWQDRSNSLGLHVLRLLRKL